VTHCLLFHAVLSCLPLQLQTAKVSHFAVENINDNPQEINSEPPNTYKHLQSYRTSRASPVDTPSASIRATLDKVKEVYQQQVDIRNLSLAGVQKESAWH